MKRLFSLVLAVLMLCAALPALAATATTFDGTVVSGQTVSVAAPFGGTVSAVQVKPGDQISVGDAIATVETVKVYAPQSGTVTGLFGQPGDTVSDVVSRRGAVLYIEPMHKYSITADIQNAYNDSDNKYVNIGETVYIHSVSSSRDNAAVGVITAASGTTYTVETSEGELLMDESVYIYRDQDYAAKSRIGKGKASRTAEVAVGASDSTGTGAAGSTDDSQSIVYLHVQNGDAVQRGQLLYETVAGPLDGLYATGNQVLSDVTGIVASVGAAVGNSIAKGAALLTVYPRDQMQVLIDVDEYDLADIQQGDTVQLTFSYDDSADVTATGTVAMISHVSETTDTSDVTYPAYIDFAADENVRLGMTVTVKVAGTDGQDATTADTAATGGQTQATGNP